MNITWLVSFFTAFFLMEGAAWALHKFVMHGPLWNLHEDHHVIDKNSPYQKNDYFAIFFAVPSFLSILFGNLGGFPWLEAAGYGVMLYGAVYFAVHEVAIHRRWNLFNLNGKYIESLRLAHQHHHQVRTKLGAKNFGMLLPPLVYFTKSKKELKKMRPSKVS